MLAQYDSAKCDLKHTIMLEIYTIALGGCEADPEKGYWAWWT